MGQRHTHYFLGGQFNSKEPPIFKIPLLFMVFGFLCHSYGFQNHTKIAFQGQKLMVMEPLSNILKQLMVMEPLSKRVFPCRLYAWAAHFTCGLKTKHEIQFTLEFSIPQTTSKCSVKLAGRHTRNSPLQISNLKLIYVASLLSSYIIFIIDYQK